MERPTSRFGLAWVGLCLCFALHVLDEALTNFLALYNPVVRAIRERLPFLPLPTFTFRMWLAGLILAVCLLLAMSVFASSGARWMIALSFVFAVVMLVNGLGHLGASIYLRRPMPGVYSSPFLLAGSINLMVAAQRLRASSLRSA